ncbi:MAG: hypothetical protein WAU71_11185, partial [Pyrinomonadaceae bacterium]
MNTLEERLERAGYNKRLADNERDQRLIASQKLECELRGVQPTQSIYDFEKAVRDEATALAAEYDSTVKLVDSRNDLEFALLEIQDAVET